MGMNRRYGKCVVLALVGLCLPAIANAAEAGAVPVASQLERLGEVAKGEVGIAAWRLDGSQPVNLRASERFPMASTFKIAVAGAVLSQVDAGKLRLDQMVTIDPDKVVSSEVIAEHFIHPGVSLSVQNLLEVMMTVSDNTATDVLMSVVGGPAEVTAWVRRQGIQDLRVDRDTLGILRDFYSLGPGPYRDAVKRAGAAAAARVRKPYAPFDNDIRDTASPAALARLVTRIASGSALSASSTQLLLEMMRRCRTGDARIRGLLPAGTRVANKTGTVGGSANDVGLIDLPDGRSIVIAIMVKKSEAPVAQRERAIAEISRSLYDYYLFERAEKAPQGNPK